MAKRKREREREKEDDNYAFEGVRERASVSRASYRTEIPNARENETEFRLSGPLHLSPIIYAYLLGALIKVGEVRGGKKESRKVVKAWTFNNVRRRSRAGRGGAGRGEARRGAISPLVRALSVGIVISASECAALTDSILDSHRILW